MSNVETAGKADLVAFFFRQCFDLLPSGSCLGFISTNSISQGDTRKSSLRKILDQGGHIFSAKRRIYWPGRASVITSFVGIRKDVTYLPIILDDNNVPGITSFLIPGNSMQEPARLESRADQAFLGVKPGQTAAFVMTKPERDDLAGKSPSAVPDIKPYVGGSDMNDDPHLFGSRYIIDVGTVEKDAAKEHTAALDILKSRMGQISGDSWWKYSRPAAALRRVLDSGEHDRALVKAESSDTFALVFLPPSCVFSNMTVVFTNRHMMFFSVMQSRVHEFWVRMTSSTFKDDLRYVARDCFETFPFPKAWQTDQSLEQAGETYYEYRATLMIRNDEGLTKTYNRFHDPDEDNPEILKLRELHATMDHAVLEAYEWHDLAERATCEFQLEYEEPEDDEDDDSGRKRKKKKPWRYKWPQDFHDEVLARLLELNQTYAEQERIAGESAVSKPKTTKKPSKKKPSKKKSSKKPPDQVQLTLGGGEESE